MSALIKEAAKSMRCMPAPQLNDSAPHSGGNTECPSDFLPSPLAPWQIWQLAVYTALPRPKSGVIGGLGNFG